jgi:DNA-binding CsgD family transcriptional regulator
MSRLELEIVDRGRPGFRPSGPFESPFTGASEEALPSGTAVGPSRIELMADTLGFLDCGWAILDRHLKVLHLNARIREFFGNGLTIVDRQLSSMCRADQEKLTSYLRHVISGNICRDTSGHHFVHLPRRDQLPLIVRAHCVSRAPPDENPGALAIALVTDPEHSPFPKQSLIQLTLGLSNSEARVALALTNGASLVQAAEHIGVSHETARTHLKNVFAKSNTNRQSELVVLLNRIFRLS